MPDDIAVCKTCSNCEFTGDVPLTFFFEFMYLYAILIIIMLTAIRFKATTAGFDKSADLPHLMHTEVGKII